ncbi:MAG: hypothetical protein ACKVU2_09355 [Saprospiraceae bacterium]
MFSGGGGRNFLGGYPPEVEAPAPRVVVTAPPGAPADVGTQVAHGIQQIEYGAFADPKVFGYLAGGTGAALANELVQTFDLVEAVVEGHGGVGVWKK